MKKIFLAVLIFSSFSSFAQLRFGIVGTPQITWMKSDVKAIETDGLRIGIAYGLNLDYSFSDNASITTGIFINNSSGKLKYSYSSSDADTILSFEYGTEIIDTLPSGVSITYKNQYLEIPIGLKFKTNEIGLLKYYAQLGLSPMIAIGAKAKSEKPDDIDNEKFLKEVSMFAIGYHIGAGVEYNLSDNTSLLAGLVYTNGFTDVTRNPNGTKKTTNQKDKTILNGISIKIGVLF